MAKDDLIVKKTIVINVTKIGDCPNPVVPILFRVNHNPKIWWLTVRWRYDRLKV